MIRCLFAIVFIVFTITIGVASEQCADYCQLMETVRQKTTSPSELKLAMTVLDGFCAKNPASKKRVLEDMKKYLSTVKNTIERANLLSSLINSENLCRDQRQLRQWIYELDEILEEETLSPDCRCRCLESIGKTEFWAGNLVEAEKAFCQLVDVAEEHCNDKALVEGLDDLELIYLRKGDRKMSEHMFKKKLLKIKSMSSYPDVQAESYASSAMNCALLRDWVHFDEMCGKSRGADGGRQLTQTLFLLLFANMNAVVGKSVAKQVALDELKNAMYPLWSRDDEEVFATRGRQLANESRYVRNMENNFAVSDFVRKASGVGFSLVEFNRITEKAHGISATVFGGDSRVKEMVAADDDLGIKFIFDLMMSEVKICKGISCATVRKELKRLRPVPFEIMQTKYSIEDAEALMLHVQLCVSQRLGDLAESGALAQKMDLLLGEVSKNFSMLMSDDCKARIAEVWIEQGKDREGRDLLFPIVKRKLESDTMVDVMSYYNLGRACRRLGALGDAEVLLSKAYQFVRPGGYNCPRGYDRKVCFYGSDICTEYAILSAAKHVDQPEIDALVDMSIEMALKGGHPDALGRAYQEAMKNLFKNPDVSRKEKLAKIEKMKSDCLSATSNPALLASYFYNSAKFEYANNMSANKIVKEIEQYFHYQQLFAGLTETSCASPCDSEMREMLLTLLGEMDDAVGIDYWNKAFEKRKTRSTEIASLSTSKDARANDVIPILLQVSKYEAASEILKREQSKSEGSRDQVLLAKATEIKRELEHNFDEAQKMLSPDNSKRLRDLLADSFVIHPDSMGQLCSVLSDDVVCLQFLAVGEKIIVYIATKGANPFITTIHLKDKGLTAKQLSQCVIKLRSKIQNGVGGKSVSRDLKSLYDVLLADIRPVLDRLKCRRAIVNSSGMLRYVPFAALYDGEKFLVERYQISNVTGLDLIRLAKAEPNRNADSVKAMVFADPDGSLPSGRKEGECIAGLFKNSQLLVGEKASITNFESMIGNVNFIHLATHAVLDSDNPRNSFILFADGHQWRYCDMMGFCVENVDSIVLSACSTAVGEKSNGGEIEGMAYQLLRKSPSGSVLASFWKVDDAATEKLMGVYYNHMTTAMKEKGTLDRGGALREAQLALLRNPETSSPYYWAAFSLFGDFR